MEQGVQGAERAETQSPSLFFSLFGYGFCLAWNWMYFYTARISPLISEDEAVPHMYRLVALAVTVIALAGIVVFHRRRLPGAGSDVRLSIFISGIGILATALMAVAGFLSGAPGFVLAIAGWICMGVSYAFLTYAWIKLYCTVAPSALCLYVCGATVLGAVAVYILCYLPITVAVSVTAALPAFSAASFLQARKYVEYDEHLESVHHISDAPNKFPSPLVHLLFATFVYTVIYAAIVNPLSTRHGYGFETNGGIMLAAPLVVGALIFAIVWFKHSESLSHVYRFVLPSMVIALVIFPFLGGWALYAAGFIGSVAFQGFNIIVWVMLSDSARHNGYSVQGSLLFSQLVYSIGMFVGSAIGSALAFNDLFHKSTLFTALCMGAVVVLVIVATFMLRESELFGREVSSGGARGIDRTSDTLDSVSVNEIMENIPSAEEIFNDKVAHVIERFDLTPREKEVFAMLAKGRSNKYIEEKLVISEHTVDSHVTHIYRKCDVHSRQEIIDMVDRERPSDDNPYTPVGSGFVRG